MADLNRKILTKIFPFSNDSKIDITHYDIQSLKVINTLDSRINIICNNELPSNYAYNLLKNIFSNIIYIKTHGDTNYKLQMQEFNPSYLYPNNSLYKLHEGVHKFYMDIGVITYNKDNSCRNFVGVKECKGENINHFRLI